MTTSPAAADTRLSEQLVALARTRTPEEACGLLLGRGGAILEVVSLDNCAPQPAVQYCLDPLAYMHTERAANRRGLDVVGVWHSHPDGDAAPSEADRLAAWPGWLYVIVGLGGSAAEVRAWRLRGARFEEETLHSCPS